jgi:hypothetical protein
MNAVPNSTSFHDAARHNATFHDVARHDATFHDLARHDATFYDAARPSFQVMIAPEFVGAHDARDSQIFFDEAGVPQFFTIADASMDCAPQDPDLHLIPHIPTTSSPLHLVPTTSSPLHLDPSVANWTVVYDAGESSSADDELERLHYEENRVEQCARTVCMDHDYDGNPFTDLKFVKAEKVSPMIRQTLNG